MSGGFTNVSAMLGGNISSSHSLIHQPRPYFFVSRSNGLLVPLIPADELPFNLRLQGAPRVIALEQTHGMQHVGTVALAGPPYKLEQDAPSRIPLHVRSQSNTTAQTGQYLAPDAFAGERLERQSAISPPPSSQRPFSAHETAIKWRSKSSTPVPSEDETQTIINSIVATQAGPVEATGTRHTSKLRLTPPSGTVVDQGEKKYCTYWIRTGACDYIQQGCLFLHKMPDRATLAKIGINNVPRWWTERNSVLRLRGGGGIGEKGKESFRPGPKSIDWLMKLRQEDEGSDSGDESDRNEADTVAPKMRVAVAERSVSLSRKASPVTDGHEDPATKTAGLKSAVAARKEPNRTVSPMPEDMRKASTTSDLIDFTSLVPASPSLQSSVLSSVQLSTESRAVSTAQSSTPRSKVLVPRDETPSIETAKAKERELASQSPSSGPRKPVAEGVMPERSAKKTYNEQKKTGRAAGLLASKHAPSSAVGGSAPTRVPAGAVGRRIRRPAKSDAVMSGMKKEASGRK